MWRMALKLKDYVYDAQAFIPFTSHTPLDHNSTERLNVQSTACEKTSVPEEKFNS